MVVFRAKWLHMLNHNDRSESSKQPLLDPQSSVRFLPPYFSPSTSKEFATCSCRNLETAGRPLSSLYFLGSKAIGGCLCSPEV